ncbi:hypothetical protein G5586_13850, partial [Staphylococcus aureus]|nr:hypothetical protein [Staphylococcus aureus]
ITAIIRYINENKVTEYLDLLNELMTHDYSLFKVACDNTILFTSVIRSNRHKLIDKLAIVASFLR